MAKQISRREMIRSIAAGGLVLAGSMTPLNSLLAAEPGPMAKRGPQPQGLAVTRYPAVLSDGMVVQPQRELQILHKTDVLVVGGGPAGTAAALAARRLNVDVTIVERYGYFGGLATGGLVLAIFPLYDRNNRQVIRGIGEEMMKRLDAVKFGIIERNKAPVYPTTDPEAFKYILVEMVLESGLTAFLDCWGVDAIIDSVGAVKGAVFESKSGRQAILADVVIDATGDGDIYAAAGAAFEKIKDTIGLVSRMGNVSIQDMLDEHMKNAVGPRDEMDRMDKGMPARGMPVTAFEGHVGSPTPAPGVNWINMKGPVGDALDVAELSRLELLHRQALWKNLRNARKRKGAEDAFIVETAPQMGVRLSRLLKGVKSLSTEEMMAGAKFKDVIGYCGTYANAPEFEIPFGCLVPDKLDNLLAAGRCVSAEFKVADTLRLIPVCWVTGQAAGVAAALSIKDGCSPRNVNISKLQNELKQQGAFLG
jgi:ribulose 1,5-bisphosphate synthetase/thiazole synthase